MKSICVNHNLHRYIGIDYSGAETPASSLEGLRVYMADCEILPQEVQRTEYPNYV
jgi:hypothetical protein